MKIRNFLLCCKLKAHDMVLIKYAQLRLRANYEPKSWQHMMTLHSIYMPESCHHEDNIVIKRLASFFKSVRNCMQFEFAVDLN